MSFALEMAMTPRLSLEVSPALVAFTEMLVLPYAAMQLVVERELCANAALERLEGAECPICRGTWQTRCPVCSIPRPGRRAERYAELPDGAMSEPDTHALLHAVRLETSADEAPIAERLIDSLDEHGRLDCSCAEIAADMGVGEPAVTQVLEVIRRAGPPGVGATSLSECLLLQLDALGADDNAARLARAVVADHLPALSRGRFTSIAKALGVSRAEIQQVLELIRQRLRPYPEFTGNTPAVTSYVVPDVVIREHDNLGGEFRVELVEPALMRLGVRSEARHRARTPPGDSAECSVARAKSFLAHIQDRWDTLRRVAEYTVEHQRQFLIEGPTALKPLTRAQVATALDLHESTVSRATAGKYALLPNGTILALARFFGVGGGIDGELRKLLEAADGPMSDQCLADRLRQAGYPIARRTVAKHRARLGFPTATLR